MGKDESNIKDKVNLVKQMIIDGKTINQACADVAFAHGGTADELFHDVVDSFFD